MVLNMHCVLFITKQMDRGGFTLDRPQSTKPSLLLEEDNNRGKKLQIENNGKVSRAQTRSSLEVPLSRYELDTIIQRGAN
jgi:hypothetical protein